MESKSFRINNIPSVIWGEQSEKVVIAVHGNMSNKTDIPIKILAKNAVLKGYQVLSFDLPEHGDRKSESTLCKVQYCVKDLGDIMKYARSKWKNISLFANSIGAYFSLLAYNNEKLNKALFLSPVVNMLCIIKSMMKCFNVSEERLKKEQTIPTPIGQNLYWDYYCYVKEHPIDSWNIPTYILYGSKDNMCERDSVFNFAEKFPCKLEIVEGAEHYFHTSEQLEALNRWLVSNM